MASRLGDQTALMQGRITLNPMSHIDPVGTILFPALVIFGPVFGFNLPFMLIGWAKPTPVNTRNFRNIVRDDNLTTLAGPASNLILTLIAILVLVVISFAVPGGHMLVVYAFQGGIVLDAPSPAQALVVLSVLAIQINLTLFFFNLLPIPPLDGSRIVRNLLPYNAMRAYESMNIWIAYLLMIVVGGFAMRLFMGPALRLVSALLVNI